MCDKTPGELIRSSFFDFGTIETELHSILLETSERGKELFTYGL